MNDLLRIEDLSAVELERVLAIAEDLRDFHGAFDGWSLWTRDRRRERGRAFRQTSGGCVGRGHADRASAGAGRSAARINSGPAIAMMRT